jgi:triacylglycerol lipase
MLAIALRLFLLFELACYAAFALRFFDATVLQSILFAIAGVFGLRLFIVALTYVLAWVHRSPAPRLGCWRAVLMVLAEYAAFIANFVFISPFERWWMGNDRLRSDDGRPPLLLIHGYGCSRAAWWWQRRHLEAAGWRVATINLEPLYASIENYLEPLARRIDEVLEESGAQRLILVGHSMGGLVARAYLRRHGTSQVVLLVTLGTPHGGSELAKFGIGENACQMRPGSAWLAALGGEAPPVETLTVYSPHDNFVLPQANLEWPGARRQTIAGLGHLAMLYSPRVTRALLDALPLPARDEVDLTRAGSRR